MKLRNLLLIPKDDEVFVDTDAVDKPKDQPVNVVEDGENVIVDLSPKDKPVVQSTNNQPHQTDPQLLAALADIQSRVNSSPNYNQPNQPDPFAAEEASINDQERALGIQWEAYKAANQLTPERLKEFDTKSRDMNQRKANIAARRSLQELMPQILRAQQAQQFQMQYSDVVSNPNAQNWAKGRYQQLLAEGAVDGPALVDRAMNDARVKFKMVSGRMAPTEQDKNQLMGTNGGGGRHVEDNRVKMGKAEKIMAMSMYGDRFNGDEKKAYAEWAKKPGMRAKKAWEKKQRNADQ
jgi:hypothetical protein